MTILLAMRLNRSRLQGWRSRASALFLLAVFVSAGTTFPSLDALVHHGSATEVAGAASHLEPAGDCLSHSAHCTLGRTASGSNAVGSELPTLRVEPVASPASTPAPQLPLRGADRGAIPHQRAPPSLSA